MADDSSAQPKPEPAGEPQAAADGQPAADAAPQRAADAPAEQPPAEGAQPVAPEPAGAPADADDAKAEQGAAGAADVKAEQEPGGGSSEAADGAAVKQEAAAAVKEEDAKPPPTDEAVVKRLRELLAEVDLAVTTEKQLRRRMEGEFGVPLGEHKALLRSAIEEYLEEQPAADEEEEDDEEDEEEPSGTRKRKAAGSSLGSYLSPEMQDFLGEERLPRTQVVKRLWAYIKEHNLQNPKNKQIIVFDDALKKLFPGTHVSMFKMQKLLSKHCKTSEVVGADSDEGEEEEGEEDDEGSPAPKKARRASAPRKPRSSSAGDGERKPNAFTKECRLSEELASFMGAPTASRPAITKFFWQYAKERNLQDPSNKQWILADDALRRLTGEERFKGFSFQTLIKQHILKD